MIRKLWQDESAQTVAEYAILAGLVAVVSIGVTHLLGTGIRGVLQQIANDLQKPY